MSQIRTRWAAVGAAVAPGWVATLCAMSAAAHHPTAVADIEPQSPHIARLAYADLLANNWSSYSAT